MDDKQLAMVLTAITQGFERVARAIEAAREAQADETLQFALGDYRTFDWSSIGASVVQSDDDGVSMIRAANGKLAKRRSNDKFGTEIWFSYADGKDEKGENRYRKVVEFRQVAPPEPLGRKTEQALSSAKPSATPPATATTQQVSAPATLPAQSDPRIVALNALNLVINEAALEGVELTTATTPQANDDAATLNMRASTLRNLIEAHKRSGPPPATSSETPAGDQLVEAKPEHGEQIAMKLQKGAVMLGNKGTTPAQDGQIVAVLNALCGGEERRHAFTRAAFNKPSFAQLTPPQRRALFEWLKPTGQGKDAKALNDKAQLAVAAVLAYAATLEPVAA